MFPKRAPLFVGVMLVAGAAILVASLGGEPEHAMVAEVNAPPNRLVTSSELADWIISGRRDFVVVDMRPGAEHLQNHIKGDVHCSSCHESADEGRAAQEGSNFVDLSKKVVLFTENGSERINLPKIMLDNPNVYRLAGGWHAWERDILASVDFAKAQDSEELTDMRRREAVRAFFAGERAAAPAAKLSLAPIRRRNAHKPAMADEGC